MLPAGHLTVISAIRSLYNVNTKRALLSKDKSDKCTSSRQTNTHSNTHTQEQRTAPRRQLVVTFIVIHVLIYSLVADVRQACNMQMLVCFSMGIFQSTATGCH